MWIITKIIDFFLGKPYKAGEVTVCPGCPEEIFIKTGWTPSKVYLALGEGCPPVCQGGVDCFDVRIVPHGFVIIIRITSQMRLIEWVASKR